MEKGHLFHFKDQPEAQNINQETKEEVDQPFKAYMVAGQLGLKSSRPLSQLGPGSTWPESTRPGVFSDVLFSVHV